MYDIIIIGAGPAGLTAGLFALRANKKILILEAKCYGGKIITANKIENYPGIKEISGFDFATELYNQVISKNGEIKYETVIRITKDKKVITNKSEYKAKAIILATGTENRKLNIENESKFIGRGISYCATCDGNFYKGKVLAVNGGGNTALEDAIYLSDIAQKIYLIHRGSNLTGEDEYINIINNKENIEVILNSKIKNINGEDTIRSIDIIDSAGNTRNIIIDGLFIAIGQEAKNQVFAGLIEMNDQGYFKTDENMHTNIDGIYAAGDARQKHLRQLTTAVNDGSIAATIAIKEIKEKENKDGSNRN